MYSQFVSFPLTLPWNFSYHVYFKIFSCICIYQSLPLCLQVLNRKASSPPPPCKLILPCILVVFFWFHILTLSLCSFGIYLAHSIRHESNLILLKMSLQLSKTILELSVVSSLISDATFIRHKILYALGSISRLLVLFHVFICLFLGQDYAFNDCCFMLFYSEH